MKKAMTALAAVFLLTACNPATGPGNKEPVNDNDNIEQQNYRGDDLNNRNMRNNNMNDRYDNNLNRRQFNDGGNMGPGPNTDDLGPNHYNNDMNSNDNMAR